MSCGLLNCNNVVSIASWSSGNSASPLIKLCSGNGWNAKIQRGSTPSVLPEASSFKR